MVGSVPSPLGSPCLSRSPLPRPLLREGNARHPRSLRPELVYFSPRTAFLRSQTEHLYGLRHRRSFCRRGYTAIRGTIVLHRLGRTLEDSRIVLISNSNWRQFFERIFDLLYRGRSSVLRGFCVPARSVYAETPSLIKAALAILRGPRLKSLSLFISLSVSPSSSCPYRFLLSLIIALYPAFLFPSLFFAPSSPSSLPPPSEFIDLHIWTCRAKNGMLL